MLEKGKSGENRRKEFYWKADSSDERLEGRRGEEPEQVERWELEVGGKKTYLALGSRKEKERFITLNPDVINGIASTLSQLRGSSYYYSTTYYTHLTLHFSESILIWMPPPPGGEERRLGFPFREGENSSDFSLPHCVGLQGTMEA